jgi:hypothetical protein
VLNLACFQSAPRHPLLAPIYRWPGLEDQHTVRTRILTIITIGPSLTGLRGTQLAGSIIYTLATCGTRTFHSPTSYLFAFLYFVAALLTVFWLTLAQGHQSFVSRPPLLEGGPIQADLVSAASEAPKAEESQDGDDAKVIG